MANPEHVELVKQGADAIRKWREQNPEITLDLTGAKLSNAHLFDTNLRGADLENADLRRAELMLARLTGARLFVADLRGADLEGAILREAVLESADLSGANLLHANLTGAHLAGVEGAHQVHQLESVRFDTDNPGVRPDAHEFERCVRTWPERWLDWERLRVVGRLPLFGISYTALILIPVVFYGLALYNDKIDLVRAWAEQAITMPDYPLHRLAPLVLERLHPRPIPRQSLLLLVSTVLLAVGSTLYTFFCPSRIKEFSRDQWCDQLGHSLLHYWPLAWKHRYIRLACAACYGLGGLGAAWVLLWKLGHTARFILEQTTWPWPWR